MINLTEWALRRLIWYVERANIPYLTQWGLYVTDQQVYEVEFVNGRPLRKGVLNARWFLDTWATQPHFAAQVPYGTGKLVVAWWVVEPKSFRKLLTEVLANEPSSNLVEGLHVGSVFLEPRQNPPA